MKRTLQIYLTGSNQDGIRLFMHAPGNGCAEKARERMKHSLMLSEEKLALGQFKTLTKQEFLHS